MRHRPDIARAGLRGAHPAILCAATAGVLCALELLLVCARTRGAVLFSLDDPYIDLALARQIAAAGHYGLNAGEPASPASSILYPFLLVPLLWLHLGQWAALLLNVAGAVASAALAAFVLDEEGFPLRGTGPVQLGSLAGAAVLGFNVAGVAFTGLEHTLHLASCLICVRGICRCARTREAGFVWLGASIACVLLRYEGATFWLASVAVLALNGRPRLAGAIAAAGLCALAGFSLFLHAHGLAWLPSSVLAKAAIVAPADPDAVRHRAVLSLDVQAAGFAAASVLLLASARRLAAWLAVVAAVTAGAAAIIGVAGVPDAGPASYHDPHGWPALFRILFWQAELRAFSLGFVLLAAFGAASAAAALRPGPRPRRLVALAACIVIFGHLAAGQFDWFSRYEIYALVSGAVFTAVLYREAAAAWLDRARPAQAVLAGLALLALLPQQAARFVQTPQAAAEIAAQQYQMRRFVHDVWRRPVAVNDLGQVAFGGGSYVLDLWGLGSRQALDARASGAGPAWMDALARSHGVDAALIYAGWFPRLPPGWVPVARLVYQGPRTILGGEAVTFLATRRGAVPDLTMALRAFAPTLPATDRLDWAASAQAQTQAQAQAQAPH